MQRRLAGDPLQQLAHHRVAGTPSEKVIASLGHRLVDRPIERLRASDPTKLLVAALPYAAARAAALLNVADTKPGPEKLCDGTAASGSAP